MRRFITLFLAWVFQPAVHGAQFDPPDLVLEQEFHRLYLIQSGAFAEPTRNKDSYIESYRIQKGESLWSLSETFYGDGHYWPRVWAQNQAISNPHLIRPGHNLQFLLGSEDETPSFRVSEDEDEKGVELASSVSQNPLIEIPPPEIPPKPLTPVPRSFPQWQSVYKQMPVQITDDKGLLTRRPPLVGKAFLTAFVQEAPLKPDGLFMEPDLDSALPTSNQYVYVKVNKGTGHVGQKMLIVKEVGRLKASNSEVVIPDEAYLIQIHGEVELKEPAQAEGSNLEEFDVYRALMTRATGLSLRDHRLMVGELQEIDLSFEGTPGTTQAQIIGSGKHQAADLFAPGDVVFLNKGSRDGMAAGQVLDVYANRAIRRRGTEVKFSPAPSGTVRVVRVTDNLATAVILASVDGLVPGDQVRQVTASRAEREVIDSKEGQLSHGADEGNIELDLDSEEPDFGSPGKSTDDPDFDTEF